MNDDFVYRALPKVPEDFARSLYARISSDDPTALPQPRGFPRIRSLGRWQVALIIISLILIVAWTQVVVRFRYVPFGDLWLVEISHPTQSISDGPSVGFIPTPGQLPTVIIEGTVFYAWNVDYLSPDWIPEGFSTIPAEMNAYGEVIGMWGNSAQETIRFFGVPRAGGMHSYAPAGMYEEVRVNGQPAILIHGRLALKKPQGNSRKWDEALGFQLYWTVGEAVYTLETFGPYLSQRDLIRMAESMKILPWPSP